MNEDFVPNENNNPEETTPGNTPQEPSQKKYPVKHILKGSRKAILNTMHTLYALRYAEISEWSPLQPTGIPGEFITMMTKYLIIG
ncbi:hypothetical protein [Moorena sp. SIO4G3]|uniref:hypothetical protein n=1 Tax=Moorena sp. SIO4G3 TaxID=2607821 RepID=UPI001429D21E|nr:hypothetical protein [Moorena sp. SIO4G3]NEO79776.1 hypothetical protein [Moorena sp. SIO4G3]